jgi:hypothetical protein
VIAALDSSFAAPSADQADAAAAAGVRVWAGYLATRSNVGLAAPWTELAFWNAKRCGGVPLAFASGWDDPAACRQLAAAWGVRLVLDCEDGIRGLGSWSQGWLDVSAGGLYGGAHVHGLRAALHVIARYPGRDPGATWPADVPRPAGPVGWQWQGTHTEFGASVDRSWLDDWFGGDMSIDPKAIDHIRQTGDDLWAQGMDGVDLSTHRVPIVARVEAKVDQLLALAKAADVTAALAAIKAELDAVRAGQQGGEGAAVDLGRVYAEVERLGAHLGVDITADPTS